MFLLANYRTIKGNGRLTTCQHKIQVMLYTHFIGRIGKDAKVINGTNGDFISVDIAVSDFFKGQETTTWIRLRSNRHINLAKWLTKGKMILVEGTLSKPTIWTDKNGQEHVQLSVVADNIHFVNVGKKRDADEHATPQETTKAGKPKDDDPLPVPADNKEDVPF